MSTTYMKMHQKIRRIDGQGEERQMMGFVVKRMEQNAHWKIQVVGIRTRGCSSFNSAVSLKLFITKCWEKGILVLFFKNTFIG